MAAPASDGNLAFVNSANMPSDMAFCNVTPSGVDPASAVTTANPWPTSNHTLAAFPHDEIASDCESVASESDMPPSALAFAAAGEECPSDSVPMINQYVCVDPLAPAGPLARFSLALDTDADELRSMTTLPQRNFSWHARDVATMKLLRHSGLVGLHEAIVDDAAGVVHLALDTMENAVPLSEAAPMDPAVLLRESLRLSDAAWLMHKHGLTHATMTADHVVVLPDGRCAFIHPCAVRTEQGVPTTFGASVAHLLASMARDTMRPPHTQMPCPCAECAVARGLSDLAADLSSCDMVNVSEHGAILRSIRRRLARISGTSL